MALGIIAAVIGRLARRHPRISFHVVTPEPPALYRELRARNVDIIIARGFAAGTEQDIDTEVLYEDQMVVVAASTSPWARRRGIELVELANEPWILVPPDSRFGSALVEAFRAKGLEAPRAMVTTASSHLRSMLPAAGRFLTMLPESQLHFPVRHPSLKALPVDLPTTRWPTLIMTLKGRTLSPVAQLFVECAREVAEPLTKRKR